MKNHQSSQRLKKMKTSIHKNVLEDDTKMMEERIRFSR